MMIDRSITFATLAIAARLSEEARRSAIRQRYDRGKVRASSRVPRRAFRFDKGVSLSDTTIALCHPRCRLVGPVVDRGRRSRAGTREAGRALRRDAGASGTRGSVAPAVAVRDAASPGGRRVERPSRSDVLRTTTAPAGTASRRTEQSLK